MNTGAILNEYMPDGDNDEDIVDKKAATGLRVKLYDDRVRVEAWDFKDGHSLAHPDGDAKMIKYQDFSKQKRVAAAAAPTAGEKPTATTSPATTPAPAPTTTTTVTAPTTVTTTSVLTTTTTAAAPAATLKNTVQPASGSAGSSKGERIALVIGILAAIGGALAYLAPRIEEQLRALGPIQMPPLPHL